MAKAKTRSPNYPAIGLGPAIDAVRAVWTKEQRTPVQAVVAAKHLGYGGLNGVARMKLSALKKYGLMEETPVGWRISEHGLRLIHHAEGSEEFINAARGSAMRIELFRKLMPTHANASDDALRTYLLIREKFGEAGAKQFIEAFRNTLAVAKLPDSSYSSPDVANEVEDMVESAVNEATDPDKGTAKAPPMDAATMGLFFGPRDQKPSTPEAPKGRLTLEVPFGGTGSATKLIVQINVTGDSLRAEHVARVRKYLELAEEDLKVD
jgi:hypothetical protein